MPKQSTKMPSSQIERKYLYLYNKEHIINIYMFLFIYTIRTK